MEHIGSEARAGQYVGTKYIQEYLTVSRTKAYEIVKEIKNTPPPVPPHESGVPAGEKGCLGKHMADRPEKTNYSPGHSIFSPYLLLPSFGIRLARSAPESLVLPRGSGTADIASPESGDAFSVSYYLTTIEIVAAQDFIPLDEAHLRRLLLEILSREEYSDIVEHYATLDRAELIHEGTPEGGGWSFKHRKEDPTPQVRITDLRLAMNLKPALFRRELKSVLENLERPITTNGVLQWKLETLRRYKNPPKDPRGILDRFEFAEEGNRLKAVSFAAATLLLLVDLDARKVRQAGVDELAQRIETLYEVVRSLAESLDASTKSLSKLLAGKDPNRPRDPEAKYYNALVLYRMGRSLHTVAERVGSPQTPQESCEICSVCLRDRGTGKVRSGSEFDVAWKSRPRDSRRQRKFSTAGTKKTSRIGLCRSLPRLLSRRPVGASDAHGSRLRRGRRPARRHTSRRRTTGSERLRPARLLPRQR